MISTETLACRSCGHNLPPENLFTLGDMAVVDFPNSPDDPSFIAPLDLAQCPDCSLVQLRHTVNPEILFRHFWYRSGITTSMRESLREIAISAQRAVRLVRDDAVLDIGTNDGTLLEFFPKNCFRAGFEPAANVSEIARSKGFTTITDFFSLDKLPLDWRHRFKVITAISMFYDLDNPGSFLEAVKAALHPEGVFIIQMNHLGSMLVNLAVDNICHEHLTYFSVRSFASLCADHGMHVERVEFNLVNGGSARFYVSPGDGIRGDIQEIVDAEYNDWNTFRSELEISKRKIRSYLMSSNPQALCGASTRGLSTLQWLELGREYFACAGDRDERKFGRYYGDTGIPIVSEDEARRSASTLFVLPWHFAKEIIEREKEFLASGGKLLFPLPRPTLVTSAGERQL